jgi:hypothetical protein
MDPVRVAAVRDSVKLTGFTRMGFGWRPRPDEIINVSEREGYTVCYDQSI